MSRPWEQFQQQPAAAVQDPKPWEQFAASSPEPPAPAPPAETAPMGFLDSMKAMIQHDPTVNIVAGAAKDTGATALSLFNMGRRAFGNPQTPDIAKPDFLKPEGTAQNIGAAMSTAAQFAIPGAAEAELAPGLAKVGLLGRSGIEAANAGGVSLARGNDLQTAAKDALVTGGITGVMGVVGKGLGPLGESAEKKLLKPVAADLKNVKGPPEEAPDLLIKNLYKHDLGGTLEQSYAKAAAKTKDLGQQLRTVLASNPAGEVDVFQALVDTSHELSANAAGNFGTNKEIGKAVNKLLDEIGTVSPNGRVNLADAQDIKQALGLIGSWKNGMRDAESTATETVANAMYTKMREAIESASGQSQAVKDINQQFSEIIPVKNALIRRIPVAARSDMIGLKQAIGLAAGGPGGLAVSAADRLLRSGTVANALVQAGKNPVENAGKLAPLVPTAMDRLRSRMNP